MAKSPEEGMAALLRNLEANTGKSIDQWVALARQAGINKHKLLVDHLKQNYGLTHGYANQVALRSLAREDAPATGSEDLVAAQYAGPKAAMLPVYEAVVAAVRSFGPDVELAPKKAYVSVRRTKQFAIIQPSTAQRVDVG